MTAPGYLLMARARVAPELAHDPRPDLTDDSAAWTSLLASALADAHEPHGLFGALNGLRCCGARLVHEGDRWLILPRPPDPGQTQEQVDAELDRDKHRWLMPHKDRLTGLLAQLPTPTEAKA